MNYYSEYYRNIKDDLLTILVCVVLFFGIMFGINACSALDWNDGVCPHCEVRYELRGASRGLKYYACPECGQEVERY